MVDDRSPESPAPLPETFADAPTQRTTSLTELLLADDDVRQMVGDDLISTAAFTLARRPGPVQAGGAQEVHDFAARFVGRSAAPWAVLGGALLVGALFLAWLLPGGVTGWGLVAALLWSAAKLSDTDLVGYLVATAVARRRVAFVVCDIDAHNTSVRQVRVVERLREAGAPIDDALLARASEVLSLTRERLATALRVDRVLREEDGQGWRPIQAGSTAADALGRDAADWVGWLEREVERAEGHLRAVGELEAEDEERRRLSG